MLRPSLLHQEELRTGERAVVRFRFIKHAEYLRLGAKLLFREGVAKGIGHVTRLLPASNNNPDQNQNQRPHRHDAEGEGHPNADAPRKPRPSSPLQ